MGRDLESIVKRIREELRAEGADGAGYSDFFIEDSINKAMYDLAELFTIKDIVTITTTAEDKYVLKDETSVTVEDILRVLYDGRRISGISIDTYFALSAPDEGSVENWTLWGDTIILVGEVEAGKELELYVTRAPNPMVEQGDAPETPYYADEAIAQFAIAACYRESKDYDRASTHFAIYQHQKDIVRRRSTPQGQKDFRVTMRDSYWGPIRDSSGSSRSDTNPGGRG